jgi:glucosamine--fructose-6-phosphate aminotransferase (isomerizing)
VARSLREAGAFHFVGCGTANIACQYAVMLLNRLGIPARFWVSSEFCYAHPVFDPNDVFVFISQSGETADSIAVLEEIKIKGNMALGFVNVVDSKIARMTDAGVYLRAGVERGVASTKAYAAQLVAMVLLALFLARQRKMTIDTGSKIIFELKTLPEKMEAMLAGEASIKALAGKYRDFKNFYFLGRYFNFVTAQEGALKIKEISYVHAESYPLGEMKHGPLALIDENFCSVVVALKDSVYEKSVANIREIKARRGRVIAIANTQNADEIRAIADDVIIIPDTLEYLSPILSVIPLQLFAYHMACELGRNPDKPRNLAKTVTVE